MIAKTSFSRSLCIVAALVGIVFSLILAFVSGTQAYTLGQILSAYLGREENALLLQIVGNIRIPRALTGLFAGMNLAVSGVLLQGILKNPIASPNIIGANAGSGLCAVAVMTLLPGAIEFIPLASFVGALLATLLIYGIARQSSGTGKTTHIVLAGVAISALLNAITQGLMTVFSDSLSVTYSWLLGSLSGRSWKSVFSIWPWTAAGLIIAIYLSPKLNLFALGDEIAGSLGLKTGFYRLLIIITASILAGSAVSVAGTIGFIGLVAPHTARLLVGEDHKFLVPLSALLGGIILTLSDTAARTLFMPVELSVGILTAFLGAPVFLIMLHNKENTNLR